MFISPKSYSFSMSDPVVVSCAGDSELAKRLHDFLLSAYPSAANTGILALTGDEVTIDNSPLGIKNEAMQRSLAEFQSQNKDLVGYAISEFGNIFTIGILQSLDKVILSCEICGYLAHHEDEMSIHKRTHSLLSIP
jgi:hypothetical protein